MCRQTAGSVRFEANDEAEGNTHVRDLSNWDRWGATDERGAANLLTEEVVLAACSAATLGRVYNLGIELKQGAPVAGRRISPVHLMSSDGGDYAALERDDWGTADDYLFLASGGTTHVDALSHVWAGGALYNGFSFREVRSSGAARCGIEKVGGLVTRALVLDFTTRPADNPIRARDIDAYLVERGLEARPGDALLFRTGWMEAALAGEPLDGRFPVVDPDAAEWIADQDIAIVGADNPAVEATGTRGTLPPLHRTLIRDLGVYIVEMLDLREPARDGVDSGLLVVAPLLISRGVNSPVNPLLIA
jgi:kynurenine formamidase